MSTLPVLQMEEHLQEELSHGVGGLVDTSVGSVSLPKRERKTRARSSKAVASEPQAEVRGKGRRTPVKQRAEEPVDQQSEGVEGLTLASATASLMNKKGIKDYLKRTYPGLRFSPNFFSALESVWKKSCKDIAEKTKSSGSKTLRSADVV